MEVTQGIVTVFDTGYHMLFFCQSLFLSLLTQKLALIPPLQKILG